MPENTQPLFTAVLATFGPLEYDVRHVGLSSTLNGDGPNVIIMADNENTAGDSEDAADSVALVLHDGSGEFTAYDAVSEAHIEHTAVRLQLAPEVAAELGAESLLIATATPLESGFLEELRQLVPHVRDLREPGRDGE